MANAEHRQHWPSIGAAQGQIHVVRSDEWCAVDAGDNIARLQADALGGTTRKNLSNLHAERAVLKNNRPPEDAQKRTRRRSGGLRDNNLVLSPSDLQRELRRRFAGFLDFMDVMHLVPQAGE